MYPQNIIENLNGLDVSMFPDDFDYDAWLKTNSGIPDWFMTQELDGSVALSTNSALALGRNIALLTYADYSIPGAEWSNPSAQIAACDGTQGGNTRIDQTAPDGIQNVTFQVTYTVSGFGGGQVRAVLGNGVGTWRAANGTYIEDIVHDAAVGELISFQGDINFVGNVNLATVLVEQTDILADTDYPGTELVTNGDFSAWTADDPDGWTVTGEVGSDPEISQVGSGEGHGGVGTGACNIFTTAGGGNPKITQTILEIGKTYSVTVITSNYVSGDIVASDVGGGGSQVISSATTTTFSFVATNVGFLVRASNPGVDVTVSFVSVTEVNPMNGTYSGATLGGAAAGNLGVAPSFDGANDYLDIYSAGINSKFTPDALTVVAFAKSATWAAGVDLIVRLGVDADNEVFLSRSGTDLIISYDAGGTAESITIASGSPSGWFMVAITVDTTGGGEVKAYYNGSQGGTTQTIAGTFVGNLASDATVIGANTTAPANVWDGFITRVGLGWGVVLTPAQILDIYTRSGI